MRARNRRSAKPTPKLVYLRRNKLASEGARSEAWQAGKGGEASGGDCEGFSEPLRPHVMEAVPALGVPRVEQLVLQMKRLLAP